MTDTIEKLHGELKRQANIEKATFTDLGDHYVEFSGRIDLRLLAGTAQLAERDRLLGKIEELLR